MTINWKNYELVLEASDSKVCEVTGRDMGGTVTHVCAVSKMKKDKQVVWEPSYGGFDTVKVTFIDTDDEAIHISIYKNYTTKASLRPGEVWQDSWWSGEWGYHVKIMLRKIEAPEDVKPFFVHTMTDDGVTSDYADAKEAYENR